MNRHTPCPLPQAVDDDSEVEMVRKVGSDGMAQEEYNFNSEVSLKDQVSLSPSQHRVRGEGRILLQLYLCL